MDKNCKGKDMLLRVLNFGKRALRYICLNIHIIISIGISYLAIYYLGYLMGWYTNFDTFFSQTRNIMFSILITVIVLDFLKSERERRKQLKSQFSLFYLLSSEFRVFLYGLQTTFGTNELFSGEYYISQKSNPVNDSNYSSNLRDAIHGIVSENDSFWFESVDLSETDEYYGITNRNDFLTYIVNKYIIMLKEICLYHSGLLDSMTYRVVYQSIRSIDVSNCNWSDIEYTSNKIHCIIDTSIYLKSKLGSLWNDNEGTFYVW